MQNNAEYLFAQKRSVFSVNNDEANVIMMLRLIKAVVAR